MSTQVHCNVERAAKFSGQCKRLFLAQLSELQVFAAKLLGSGRRGAIKAVVGTAIAAAIAVRPIRSVGVTSAPFCIIQLQVEEACRRGVHCASAFSSLCHVC